MGERLFDRMDSEYIKLCRINDVLDELYPGKEGVQIHPSYFIEEKDKETREVKSILKPDKGIVRNKDGSWTVSDEYLKYYKMNTGIDYSAVFTLIKKVYESRNGIETSKEDQTPIDLSEIKLNPTEQHQQREQYNPEKEGYDPIKAMKAIAFRFYSSVFPDEGQPGATEFSKKTLSKVKKILYPETYGRDDQYGELWIYTKDEREKCDKVKDIDDLPQNGTNKSLEFADGTIKHMVLLCLENDDKGSPIPTFQKLYTLVHEISHSLGNDKGINTRVGNIFGETESMIIESLFSKFLLENDDIQIPDKEKKVLSYEHGPSRVRTLGELLSIYKLGAQFYQRKQEEIQGKNVYIDYEDEKTMDEVLSEIFGRDARPEERKNILYDLNKLYKDWDPKHVFNDYFSHRYTIGNLIAPYIANTYFANPQLGRQYIDKFWSMAYGKNPDGSEHTIAEVLESIRIKGEKGLEHLADEYTEWVTLANNGETDKLFKGKTRYQLAEREKYVSGRKLGSQVVADIQDIEETDRENEEIARQQREISQTKENQDIGE